MRLRSLAAAAALSLAFGGIAAACDGQEGTVIFEDNFADDSGGWELNEAIQVVPPELVISLNEKYYSWATQNLTFNASDGDFCADVLLPKSLADDNTIGVGVQFWANDYNNIMMAMIFSNGAIGLFKRVNGAWTTIFMVRDSTAVKPDAPNALRVLAKAGKITVIVNGATIKAVRAQMPQGNLRFGLYAQSDKAPAGALGVHFTGFKATTGP